MRLTVIVAAALVSASSASAFTLKFVNNCPETVWPAVGQAPNGQPSQKIKFGKELKHGQSTSFKVDDHALGVRAWGRTGCNAQGASCKTGNCKGGLVCTDAGLNSGVLVSEFGFGDFGKFGGPRTAWDLSRVNLDINLPTRLSSSDGKTVTCTKAHCPPDQAYNTPTDFEADRNSPLGITYTHTFCP